MITKPERLQKILSSFGITSRREAEKLILEGRVCVNGDLATLGQRAIPGIDTITIDGAVLENKDSHVYLMLNKPRGYLTTVRDDRGRKTVMDLLTGLSTRVYPVGRLDMYSEGLLLLTNDGGFANNVIHPSFSKHKIYEAEVRGDINKAIDLLGRPVVIDNRAVRACKVKLINKTADGGVLRISIIEGRNRQIRKMCTACGVTVKALKRIAVGSLELGNLEPGKWRYLTEEEVRALG